MRRVTISGADDKVRIQDLETLSGDFPFVEWGILLSRKRVGTPRYPSVAWLKKVIKSSLALSGHLCGEISRLAVRDGWIRWPEKKMADAFKRRQVNGYGAGTVKAGSLQTLQPKGTILQCMLMDDFPQIVKDAKSIDGSILFDPSGGRGVFVSGWPMPPYEVPVGLAGGIGPDNIADLLRQWTNPGPDAWIDLESKARDENDRFDLGKVRETLEEAKRSGWPSES